MNKIETAHHRRIRENGGLPYVKMDVPKTDPKCAECSAAFTPKNVMSRFCRKECRIKFNDRKFAKTRNTMHRKETRKCFVCAKDFETRKDSRGKTCGRVCATSYSYIKKQEKLPLHPFGG